MFLGVDIAWVSKKVQIGKVSLEDDDLDGVVNLDKVGLSV